MAEVASAYVSLIPSFKGGTGTIAKELSGPAEKAGRQAGDKAGAGFKGRFTGALKGLVAPLAAIFAGAQVVRFFGDSITAASGLNESINALNVTYGDASEGVQALGKNAATALGLSNLEFNNLAVRFSSFSKTIAGDGGDVVGTLDDLTTRASDFASVMNIDVAEAARLFQSGLAGESEPLRQFGIDMSAGAVTAFAYSSGIAESGKKLTEAQKVQARYGLIMEQTSATQGDFANTSDSLANQQRILSSRFEDTKARVGSALLPAMQGLTGFITGTVLPGFERLTALFADKVVPGFKALIDLLVGGDFTAEFGKIFGVTEDSGLVDFLFTVREAALRFVDFITTKVVPGVKGLIDLLIGGDFTAAFGQVFGVEEDSGLVNALFNIRDAAIELGHFVTGTLVPGISSFIGWMIRWREPLAIAAAVIASVFIPHLIALQITAARTAILTGLAWIKMKAEAVRAAVVHSGVVLKMIAGWVLMAAQATVNAVKMALSWVVGIIAPAAAAVGIMIASAARVVAGWVLMGVQSLIQAARMAAAWFIALGPVGWVIAIVIGLVALIIANWDKIVDWTKKAWTNVTAWLSKAWANIKTTASNVWNAILAFFRAIPGKIVQFFLNFTLPGLMIKHWASIKEGAVKGWNAVVDFIRGIPGKIVSALGDLGDLLRGAGRAILDGFLGGIRDGFEAVKSFVGGIGSWIADNKGPKAYDLKLLRPAGGWIMEGLEDGIEGGIPSLQRTLRDVSSGITVRSNLNDLRATGAAIGSTSGGGGVTFNGPVTTHSPEELVSTMVRRQRDALHRFGLVGATA